MISATVAWVIASVCSLVSLFVGIAIGRHCIPYCGRAPRAAPGGMEEVQDD